MPLIFWLWVVSEWLQIVPADTCVGGGFFNGLLIVPLVVIGVLKAAAIGAAIGATVEVGMQSGKQVLGQVIDNWDNGRPLTDIDPDCIDINWRHVGVSASIGAVAPGVLSTAKTVNTSRQAIKALSGQAANTTNRAAKLTARIGAHKDTIKAAVGTQAVAQGAKAVGKCVTDEAKERCAK